MTKRIRFLRSHPERRGLRMLGPLSSLLVGAIGAVVVIFFGGSDLLGAGLAISGGIAVAITFAGILFFPNVVRNSSYLLSMLVAVAAGAVAPTTIEEMDFYSASAQIAPVLLLAVAVETRGLHDRASDPYERLMLLLLIVFILTAGGESLRVLAIGEPRDGWAHLVIGALAGASLQLLVIGATETSRSDSI